MALHNMAVIILQRSSSKFSQQAFRNSIIKAPSSMTGSLTSTCSIHDSPKNITPPENVQEQNDSQKIKFSPQRARDSSASQISAKLSIAGAGSVFGRGMAGTESCHSYNSSSLPTDSHLPIFDQVTNVSLSGVTQTNVPNPFHCEGNLDKVSSSHFTGAAVPGEHWRQNDKFVSSDLHDNHNKMNNYSKKGKSRSNKIYVDTNWDTIPEGYYCKPLSRGHWCVAWTPPSSHLRSYHTSSHLFSAPNTPPPPPPQSLTQRQKLQRAVKEYGSTVIIFHVTISLASLGLCYLLVSSGIDMEGVLRSLGIDFSAPVEAPSTPSDADDTATTTSQTTTTSTTASVAAGVSTFVVAYAVHKVFAPVRIAITLTSTPFIVRSLRAKGILKPPKPSV